MASNQNLEEAYKLHEAAKRAGMRGLEPSSLHGVANNYRQRELVKLLTRLLEGCGGSSRGQLSAEEIARYQDLQTQQLLKPDGTLDTDAAVRALTPIVVSPEERERLALEDRVREKQRRLQEMDEAEQLLQQERSAALQQVSKLRKRRVTASGRLQAANEGDGGVAWSCLEVDEALTKLAEATRVLETSYTHPVADSSVMFSDLAPYVAAELAHAEEADRWRVAAFADDTHATQPQGEEATRPLVTARSWRPHTRMKEDVNTAHRRDVDELEQLQHLWEGAEVCHSKAALDLARAEAELMAARDAAGVAVAVNTGGASAGGEVLASAATLQHSLKERMEAVVDRQGQWLQQQQQQQQQQAQCVEGQKEKWQEKGEQQEGGEERPSKQQKLESGVKRAQQSEAVKEAATTPTGTSTVEDLGPVHRLAADYGAMATLPLLSEHLTGELTKHQQYMARAAQAVAQQAGQLARNVLLHCIVRVEQKRMQRTVDLLCCLHRAIATCLAHTRFRTDSCQKLVATHRAAASDNAAARLLANHVHAAPAEPPQELAMVAPASSAASAAADVDSAQRGVCPARLWGELQAALHARQSGKHSDGVRGSGHSTVECGDEIGEGRRRSTDGMSACTGEAVVGAVEQCYVRLSEAENVKLPQLMAQQRSLIAHLVETCNSALALVESNGGTDGTIASSCQELEQGMDAARDGIHSVVSTVAARAADWNKAKEVADAQGPNSDAALHRAVLVDFFSPDLDGLDLATPPS